LLPQTLFHVKLTAVVRTIQTTHHTMSAQLPTIAFHVKQPSVGRSPQATLPFHVERSSRVAATDSVSRETNSGRPDHANDTPYDV